MFFCNHVISVATLLQIIHYLYHYAYSNIFDVAESLTQIDHGPI